METIKVLIDNGHGLDTPGKHSPDGRLREYAYAREITRRLIDAFHSEDIEAHCLVPEEKDIPLVERVNRANRAHAQCGKKAILLSIHCNAAGSGAQWMTARGWSIFVSPNASQKSKTLAGCIEEAARRHGVTIRRQYPTIPYWTQDLYICSRTQCPAVLIENFFQDNRADVDFLLSEAGKQCVTEIAVEGTMAYIRSIRTSLKTS